MTQKIHLMQFTKEFTYDSMDSGKLTPPNKVNLKHYFIILVQILT